MADDSEVGTHARVRPTETTRSSPSWPRCGARRAASSSRIAESPTTWPAPTNARPFEGRRGPLPPHAHVLTRAIAASRNPRRPGRGLPHRARERRGGAARAPVSTASERAKLRWLGEAPIRTPPSQGIPALAEAALAPFLARKASRC